MNRRRSSAVGMAALLWLGSACEGSAPAPESIVISNLQVSPRSASRGEGFGRAFPVLVVTTGTPPRPSLVPVALVGGAPAPIISLLAVDDHTVRFGVPVSTESAGTVAIEVHLEDISTKASSNVLSGEFRITEDLDVTFGQDGTVIHGLSSSDEEATAVAVQSDGRVVVGGIAGRAMVERYLADGTPDTSFASGGRYEFGGTLHEVHAVAVLANGNILAAGKGDWYGAYAMLIRLLPDGTPDPAFGTDGVVTTPFWYGADSNAIAVQPDGKIVVAGWVSTGTDSEALVMRYMADGALDATFGTSGIFRYSDPAGGADLLYGVALDAEGRILVAGSSSTAATPPLPDLLVLRLTPDGSLDPEFASLGAFRRTLLFATGRGIAVQRSGRIVVGGSAWSYTQPTVLFAMGITPTGTLDGTFGDGGVFQLAAGGGGALALSASEQPILVGGLGNDALVVRLTSEGVLDPAFSGDGHAAISSRGLGGFAAVAVQSDGKIVAAGRSTMHDGSTDADVFLARLLAP